MVCAGPSALILNQESQNKVDAPGELHSNWWIKAGALRGLGDVDTKGAPLQGQG